MERIERLLKRIENPQLAAELHALYKELYLHALIDSLTGLKNRRYFDEQLAQELQRAKTETSPLSILIIDIDNFKLINDRLGHPKGDEVLRDVAAVMKKNLRQVDLIARFGGEEFAVILPGSAQNQAIAIAERVRSAVANDSFSGQKLTISCGVASFPEHTKDATSLVLLADRAMYCAKAASKNKVLTAGQFAFKLGKKATLGYLPSRDKPASLWVERKFYPLQSWQQIADQPPCFIAESNCAPLFLLKHNERWFLME